MLEREENDKIVLIRAPSSNIDKFALIKIEGKQQMYERIILIIIFIKYYYHLTNLNLI